ncbi:MAG: extradiol ring-cleavage dioxygenase [Armatimonadota bacterium]
MTQASAGLSAPRETGLVWAAILPHGPEVVPEVAADPALMAETRSAMEEAGRRFAAARPDTVILLDPLLAHNQNLFEQRLLFRGEGTLPVGVAARASGRMGRASEEFECDLELAQAILAAGRAAGLPVVAEPGEKGKLPLVGGALIPLWFTVRPLAPPRPRLVMIAPSPGVPREELVRFGRLLAEVAAASGERVALIASADHGHTHDANHARFGYSPAAAQYDALYCEAVSAGRLERLLTVSDELLIGSWADSLWQTLILAGALQVVPMPVDLLSYAVPSYYGMVVAVYSPPCGSPEGGVPATPRAKG